MHTNDMTQWLCLKHGSSVSGFLLLQGADCQWRLDRPLDVSQVHVSWTVYRYVISRMSYYFLFKSESACSHALS